MLDALALVAVIGLKLLLALGLLRQIFFVVPAVGPDFLVPDLNNSVDGDVEEVAIVGNQNEREGIIR